MTSRQEKDGPKPGERTRSQAQRDLLWARVALDATLKVCVISLAAQLERDAHQLRESLRMRKK